MPCCSLLLCPWWTITTDGKKKSTGWVLFLRLNMTKNCSQFCCDPVPLFHLLQEVHRCRLSIRWVFQDLRYPLRHCDFSCGFLRPRELRVVVHRTPHQTHSMRTFFSCMHLLWAQHRHRRQRWAYADPPASRKNSFNGNMDATVAASGEFAPTQRVASSSCQSV